MKILKHLTSILPILLIAMGVYSCSDDDNANTQQAIPITFNTNHVALSDEEGERSKTVQIEGEGYFSVKSENEDIAKASLNGKTITISIGAKSGATTIFVAGTKGERGEITVNSGLYNLTVNRSTLNMKPGETAEVKVLSGNFTYAGEELIVEAINEEGDDSDHFELSKEILWRDAKRTIMTVKALKAGKTIIRLTDLKGKTAEIALDVLDIELNNLAVNKEAITIYGIIGNDEIEITNGNGEYNYNLSDKTIVNISNTGTNTNPVYLLKAQSIGNTILTITDKLTDQSKDVNIEVKDFSGFAAKLPSNVWMGVDFKKYAELYPDKVPNLIPELTWEIEAKINAGSSATLLGIEGQFLARTPYADSNTKISVCVADNPNIVADKVLDKNTYYKFTFVVNFNTKTTDIYIDGIKQAVKIYGSNNYSHGGLKLTSPHGNESNLFGIGRAAGGRYLNGGIRYLRMWSRCLTEDEVKQYAGKLTVDPTSPGLLVEWVFEGKLNATEFRSLNEPYFVATVKGGTIDEYEAVK